MLVGWSWDPGAYLQTVGRLCEIRPGGAAGGREGRRDRQEEGIDRLRAFVKQFLYGSEQRSPAGDKDDALRRT